MAKVSLRRETGSLIHFCHPYWAGIAFFGIAGAFFILSFSSLHAPAGGEIRFLAGFFAIVGIVTGLFRLELKFMPNNRNYSIAKGFWPVVKTRTGNYDELIGVVLTKKRLPTLSRRIEGDRFLWTASFAFTSVEKPISYFASRDEVEAKYQFERFAKHFQTKAFDRTDPLQIVETNWNHLNHVIEEQGQATQNIPDVDLESPPKDVRLEYGRNGFRVEMPIQGFRFKFLLIFISGFLLLLFSVSLFFQFTKSGDPNNFGLYLLLTSFVGGLLNVATGLVGYYGRERLMYYKGKIHSDFIFLSTPFWEKSIPSEQVESISVRERTSDRWLIGNRRGKAVSHELIIQSDFQRILFGHNNDRETLEWIRAALIHKILDQDMAS